MKLKNKLLLGVSVLSLSMGALGMQSSYEEVENSRGLVHIGKKYRVGCNTNSKGLAWMESFPNGSPARVTMQPAGIDMPQSIEGFVGSKLWGSGGVYQDQLIHFEKAGGGKYRIACDTNSKGRTYMEAYPNGNPKRVSMQPYNGSEKDQLFFLEHAQENMFRIGCDTNSKGRTYMEAYPDGAPNRVSMQPYNGSEKDQLFFFVLANTHVPSSSSVRYNTTDKSNDGCAIF